MYGLKPAHTDDYSRRIQRLSPLSRRFRRQSHFSATVWTDACRVFQVSNICDHGTSTLRMDRQTNRQTNEIMTLIADHTVCWASGVILEKWCKWRNWPALMLPGASHWRGRRLHHTDIACEAAYHPLSMNRAIFVLVALSLGYFALKNRKRVCDFLLNRLNQCRGCHRLRFSLCLVHTGDYSRRIRRLSPVLATVAISPVSAKSCRRNRRLGL